MSGFNQPASASDKSGRLAEPEKLVARQTFKQRGGALGAEPAEAATPTELVKTTNPCK